MHNKMKEFVGPAILICMGLVIALILAEVGARFLPVPAESREAEKMLQCDRLVGWRGKPNLTSSVDLNNYQHNVTRNSWGMHDKEYGLEKKDGVFRILVLGDSYIEAIEVEEEQSSQAILEKILNEQAPISTKFEVISGSIHGWGPHQELMYFRSEGQYLQPDLILVFWVPANDLINTLPYQGLSVEGVNCFSPYFAICDGQFNPEPFFAVPGIRPIWKTCSASTKLLTNFLNQLYTHSHLFQRLGKILAINQEHLSFSHRFAPWVIDDSSDETLNYSYQLTADIYQQLAKEGEQIDARTAFVIVPFNQAVYSEVYPDLAAAFKREFPEFEHVNPTLPNEIFTHTMQDKEQLVFDLHPYFVKYIRENGEDLHWPGDIHWNIAGNRVAAETVANWLIDQRYVPVGKN